MWLIASLAKGVYTKIAMRSGIAILNLIFVSATVINNNYKDEFGVILFNHSAKDF